MPTSGATTIVLADTSVVLNLAIIDRLALLGALPRHRFRVPDEVVAEVRRPELHERLARALETGQIKAVALAEIAVLERFEQLRGDLGLGRGEAACLALAEAHGWMVACDEKRRFRLEARRLLGEGRLLNTPGLFLLAIRHRYWTASEADEAKEILERHRYRMLIRSFHELMRRKAR